MKKKKYVVGFMFNEDMSEVALIHKQNPEWQRDLMNGIGGKIEENETPASAMKREFREEARLITRDFDWKEYVVLEGKESRVHFFYSILPKNKFSQIATKDYEIVETILVSRLDLYKVIENLKWLIPMAIWINNQFSPITNLPIKMKGENIR